MADLKPCPFCGGEAALEQTGKLELTIRCVGAQPSGLRGCGPQLVQKITKSRFTLEWLAEAMAEKWNRRAAGDENASLRQQLADARETVANEAAKIVVDAQRSLDDQAEGHINPSYRCGLATARESLDATISAIHALSHPDRTEAGRKALENET